VQQRPNARILVGIGLVAGCGLAEQVLLTRLLSAVLYYHFTFLAISLALLGTGAGAIIVFIRPQWFDRSTVEKTLAGWSALFGVLLVLAPVLLAQINYSAGGNVTIGFALQLALICLIAFFPFLAGGIVITLGIRAYTSSVNRVYAADLGGAAIGAVVSVPVLWLFSAPTAMIILGAFAGVAAVLFSWRAAYTRRVAVAVALGACGVAAISATTSLTDLTLPGFSGVTPAAVKWSPLNRVVGYSPPHGTTFSYLFYDKVYAPVPGYKRGQPYPNWLKLSTGSESVAFPLTTPNKVLVIGGGGGRDIFDALSSGAKNVDVIELNSAIVNMVDGPLGKWSGAPYTLPGVHTTVGDGRAVLAKSSTKYNVINIGFTDTLSGSSANALALSENNLYTTQAFQEYFQHLAPGGILSVSRLYHLTGDEALRATVLMLQSLQDYGIKDPEQHVAVVLGKDLFGGEPGTVIASLKPFTPAQLTTIRTLAAQRGRGVAYIPGGPDKFQWKQLAQLGPEAFCATYQYNVCAPTDNKPFFFNMKRLSQIATPLPAVYDYSVDPYMVLGITLGLLIILCAIAFGVPLAAVRRQSRPPVKSLLFFAAIGLGYLGMEIVMIQFFVLFLGFPTYSLTVVLFSLLLFTGLGALISNRWRRPQRSLLTSLGVLVVLLFVSAYWLEPALRGMISLPFSLRVVVSVGLLAPLGITAGMAMPIGLRRFSSLYPNAVPWAWGVNGIASVLAAALAVFVAITWGYAITTLAAAVCYLVAIADAAFGRWPSRRALRQLDERDAAAQTTVAPPEQPAALAGIGSEHAVVPHRP
jgi:hypothetical protein